MKMMRRHDNSNKRLLKSQNLTFLVIVAVGAFVLFCSPIRVALSQVLYSVAPSVWGVRAEVAEAENGFWGNFRIKRSLVYENTILREDVARMQAQVLDRNLLEEKVLKLEEALGRAGSDNRVSAKVLSGPGQSPYDILAIDAGVDQGVTVGDPVVYAGAGVIGETAEVYPSSAKVKLYSSGGDEHLVLIGEKAIPVMAHGRGAGNFEAKLPKGSPVAVGDSVVLSQGNLVLGIVGLINEEQSLPFVNVFFRTLFNISEIRSVEVIIGKR